MLRNGQLTYVSLFSCAGVGCYGFHMEDYVCSATNELLPRQLSVQRDNNKCQDETGYAIATELIQLFRTHTANIENASLAKTGWDMARGEGSQTRSNQTLMALRNDTYQGRSISIEPHVRKGNRDNSPDCVRVFFVMTVYLIESSSVMLAIIWKTISHQIYRDKQISLST